MSRPVVRIAVSTLIALILFVAVFTSVQGALLSREQARVGGVNNGLDRNRPTIDGFNSSSEQAPADAPNKQGEGGCDQEAQMDPYD